MTKKELFKKAHELTRKMKAEFPTIDYRAQFSICLKELYKENATNTTPVTKTTSSLSIQTRNFDLGSPTAPTTPVAKTTTPVTKDLSERIAITVNNVTRYVAIKFKGDIMYGMINNTKFIWDKKRSDLPILDIADKSRMVEASRLAVPSINGRLKAAKDVA